MRAGMHGAVVSIAIALAMGCKYHGAAEQDAAPRVGIGFQFTNSLTDEGVGTHRVAIGLAEPSSAIVTAEIVIEGGSAEVDADYSLDTQMVTFQPGDTLAEVVLTIAPDGEEEGDETVELRFGQVTNAVVIHDVHTINISANLLPRVHFATPNSNAAEDGPTARSFEVLLDVPAQVDVVVGYAFTGTATAGGVDYTATGDMIMIPAGMMMTTINLEVVDDPYDEYEETFDVTLTALAGAVLSPTMPTTHSHEIDDNDPEPTVSFVETGSSGMEAAGGVAFSVTLSELSGKNVSVQCAVSGGTAGSGEYAVSGCPIAFPPGTGSRNVTVTPSDDTTDEEDETVIVTLSGPSEAGLGANTSHTFAITDDDASPSISFSATSTTAEDGGSVMLTVTKSAASERIVSFNVTITGGSATPSTDYTVSAGPYTIPIGMMSANVQVDITSDNLDESNETFQLGFSNLTAATAGTGHSGTITDDDVGASWESAGLIRNEGNGSSTDSYTYNVDLDASSTKTVLINVIVTGTHELDDGSVSPTSLTFNPGDTEEPVVVTIQRDNNSEQDDTFVLTLQAVEYVEIKTPGQITHTVNDDD